MQMLPFTIIIDHHDNPCPPTRVLVMAHMITHYEQGPSGNLLVHVMSGRILYTDISFDDFVSKQVRTPSSIAVPR